MKALITGGAGFIGSHLADALIEAGNTVAVVDNLSTGRLNNISHLISNPAFEFHNQCLEELLSSSYIVRDSDCIFHLAAVVGVSHVLESPYRMLTVNHSITSNLLKLASQYQKPIFLASSSEVYGKALLDVPLEETDAMIFGSAYIPRWGYALSKAMDEHLALATFREFGLPVVIGRFFNTVGLRQTGDYGMVLPRFIQAALRNEPLQVYGDGEQKRAFSYVKDTVRVVVKLMSNKETYGQIFNIGNPFQISILELAHVVKELTKSRSKIQFIPYKKVYGDNFEDRSFACPSLAKLKSFLGDVHYVSIEEVVSEIAEEMSQLSFSRI